ncbi:MAG: hypothetical protein QM724_09155 [Flavobacteriales bacterium]
MKVLLDPNVPLNMYLDGIQERSMPMESTLVMDALIKRRFTGFFTPVGFHIVMHFLKGAFKREGAIVKGRELLSHVQMVGQDHAVFAHVLNSGWTDVEDASQYFAAKADPRITHIVTTNGKHFKKATGLSIVDPAQLLALL